MMWCIHRTNIYLDDEQCRQLDRIAAEEGRTRSDVVRSFIERGLSGGDNDVDRDLQAIEASFGVMRDLDAGARGHDERADHLDRMWQAEL
jgi:predicted DNA-binding protein